MEIPGFQIQKTIGRGGMATVYLAVQESLGRSVVLKTINTAEAESETYGERLVNEARIIAALRHPHIITIYDVGATEELVYIAMEYVDGGDLDARIRTGLEPVEALDILSKVASALDFAHREGVVHRDVKPANILFRRDGTPVLTDFGIAKRTRVDSELTSTGTILGSPYYMSPEQTEGTSLDGRTDVYSLGIIFYEMLTGRRPYVGDSAIKVLVQHLQSPVPTLPGELERFQPLLRRMLAKNRDERFPHAKALAEAAEEGRRAEIARTRRAPPTPPPKARSAPAPPPRRRGLLTPKAAWMLAGGVVFMATGFGTFYAYTQTLQTPKVVATPSSGTESGAVLGNDVQAKEGAASREKITARAREAADATPEPLRGDVVQALEWLAENSLRQDRLTRPPADNAYYYYSRLLAIDPDNPDAREGFRKIAERYVVLAEQEYAEKNFRQARTYITLGLQVQPDNESLRTLQAVIDNRERSWLESFVDFFTGRAG